MKNIKNKNNKKKNKNI